MSPAHAPRPEQQSPLSEGRQEDGGHAVSDEEDGGRKQEHVPEVQDQEYLGGKGTPACAINHCDAVNSAYENRYKNKYKNRILEQLGLIPRVFFYSTIK